MLLHSETGDQTGMITFAAVASAKRVLTDHLSLHPPGFSSTAASGTHINIDSNHRQPRIEHLVPDHCPEGELATDALSRVLVFVLYTTHVTSSLYITFTMISTTSMPFSTDIAARVTSTPIGPALKVPIRFFLDHILPPLPSGLLPNKIVMRLEEGGRYRRHITASNRWRGCSSEPSKLKRPLKKTFDFFFDTVQAIVDAGDEEVRGLEHLLVLQRNAGSVFQEGESNGRLPDAYFSRRGCSINDIGVVGKFKKQDTARDKADVRVISFFRLSNTG